jgi:hypothetical protein
MSVSIVGGNKYRDRVRGQRESINVVDCRMSLFMSCCRPNECTGRSDNVVLVISLRLAAERRVCIHSRRNPYLGGVHYPY